MGRTMRAALLVAVASACLSGVAEARMQLVQRAATFRTSANNSNGYVDSSFASVNGSALTTDTAYVDVSDIVWENFSVGTGQFGAARLWFTSSNNTSTDTLYFALEPIAPDGQPVPSTTLNAAVATTSGDESISALITSDSDFVSPNIAFCKSLRIRLRSDTSSSSWFPNAKIWITFYADVN